MNGQQHQKVKKGRRRNGLKCIVSYLNILWWKLLPVGILQTVHGLELPVDFFARIILLSLLIMN